MLPRVQQVCFRHFDRALAGINLFLARAGIDAVALGALLSELCLCEHKRRFEFGIRKLGEDVALLHTLPGDNHEPGQAAANLRGNLDLGGLDNSRRALGLGAGPED